MQESFERRITRKVPVGDRFIGGDAPVLVQTMITEETENTPGAVKQITELYVAGAEMIRITTPTLRAARALRPIKEKMRERGIPIPIVADVHDKGREIAIEAARHAEKVRLNPGLFSGRKRKITGDYTPQEIRDQQEQIAEELIPVIKVLKQEGRAARFGANHGSLSERLTYMYGDTPLGMVMSTMEFIDIAESENYHDIILSLKASNVPTMIAANRLMVSKMDERRMNYPLHLGVTEAGKNQEGIVKGTIGIGTLLMEGIGDTIRVSLTGDPKDELSVCYDILQSTGRRRTKTEIIACPGCGRTKFNLEERYDEVTKATGHLGDMQIAVMGCIVNGPGEVKDADYGYFGLADGMVSVRRKSEEIKKVPQEKALEELKKLIKQDGRWIEPPAV